MGSMVAAPEYVLRLVVTFLSEEACCGVGDAGRRLIGAGVCVELELCFRLSL